MKTLLTISLLLAGQFVVAQTTNRTRFYMLNMKGRFSTDIRTTLNRDRPISIDNRTYTLIETDADTIGLVVGNETHPLPFEAGKTYYFTSQVNYFGSLIISEVSERVFWLTANVNNTRKSTRYFLSKDGTLQQTK